MADNVDKATRSRMMAANRSKDTKLELNIRKGLHRIGFRYSLNSRKVVGRPDIILPAYNAVIFVHGCFWHGHDCHLYRPPKSNTGHWTAKYEKNHARDIVVSKAVEEAGWRQLTIWECSVRGGGDKALRKVASRVGKWLCSNRRIGEIRG